MNRREASKNETRQIILKAARALFAKNGMEECTIRDIARKAGVSPASVVVHFKSKTALLEEALISDIEEAQIRLCSSMPDKLEFEARLMYLFKGFLMFYDKNRDLYRALLRSTIFEPSGETPGLTRQSDEFMGFLVNAVEEQKSLGMIRADVDSMVAASSIFFLYIGALVMVFRMPEMAVEEVADFLSMSINQYVNGIKRGG